MKKFLSVIISLTIIFGLCFTVMAENEEKKLTFNSNGKFNILHVTDCQDKYPATKETYIYLDYVLKNYDIDLVVLGGDNDVSDDHKEEGIEELVNVFVSNETYFTLVFGNHDHQQGFTNAELFEMYVKYGGEYFLGTDLVDSQQFDYDYKYAKSGTHFLPVYSSTDNNKAAYGLYMFDSGSYVIDEEGNEFGYNSVEPYQIDWYKSVRDDYKTDAGYLPSIAFQHIVCGEVYDELYFSSAVDLGDLGESFYGNNYTFVPKTNNFTGFVSEKPCPGYYNYGQMDAFAENGDVQALFCGHDHTNSYDVLVKGVHVINTPSPSFASYHSELNQGARLITLDEKTGTYSTELITVNSLCVKDADFAESVGISQATANFYEIIGDILLKLAKALGIFGEILIAIGVK